MEIFLLNPISIWLRWLIKKIYFEIKHRNSNLELGYLADVKNSKFGKYNTLYKYSRISNCILGDFSYISKNSQVYNTQIGKFSCIGPNVQTGLGVHPSSKFVSSHPIFYSTLAQSQITFVEKNLFEEFPYTTIGNDVWIGANTIIRDGIEIGDGVIIGAGAVVTKNIPPYAIAVGSPAKVIKYRFTEDQIRFLQEVKWWDKDLAWIKKNKDLFTNIDSFISTSFEKS